MNIDPGNEDVDERGGNVKLLLRRASPKDLSIHVSS